MAHWEHRKEQGWRDFHFNQPFAAGLQRLKHDVLAKTDFDPATLWQWGTVQALAVLEILKGCEARFGKAGQQVVKEALRKVGYETARQMLAGTTRPEGISDAEYMSYFITTINCIMYASLEEPEVSSEQEAACYILWCPHQDTYKAFDCRVQRYFVIGLIEAFQDCTGIKGMQLHCNATIPAGAPKCHFSIWIDAKDDSAWLKDTADLDRKGLRHARAKRQDP